MVAQDADHQRCLNDIIPVDVFHYMFSAIHRHLCALGSPNADVVAFASQVSQVCRSWRALALQIPSIWSTIVFDSPSAPSFEKQILWFKRSKDTPVTISMDERLWEDTTYDDIMQMQEFIAPEIRRCRALTITNAPGEVIGTLLGTLNNDPAPLLETLVLSTDEKAVNEWEDWRFEFFSELPKLRTAYLFDIPTNITISLLNVTCLKALRLSLLCSNFTDTTVEILHLLESLPQLEELTVEDEIDSDDDSLETRPLHEHRIVRAAALRSFVAPSVLLPKLFLFLDLPNIRHLPYMSLDLYTTIRDMARRPDLDTIGVYDSFSYEEDVGDLARFISLFPNLTSLRLIAFDFDKHDHTRWLISKPKGLRSLELRNCEGLTGERLCSIVQGRLDARGEVVPLRELSVVTAIEEGIQWEGIEQTEWRLLEHLDKVSLKRVDTYRLGFTLSESAILGDI